MADEQDYRDAAEKTVVVGRAFEISKNGKQLPATDGKGKWVPAWILVSNVDAEPVKTVPAQTNYQHQMAGRPIPKGRPLARAPGVPDGGVDDFIYEYGPDYKKLKDTCDDGEPHEWCVRAKSGGGLEQHCKHCKRTK